MVRVNELMKPDAPKAVESEVVMSSRESWKSFGIKAFKTFLQGFFGTLTASGALTTFDASLLEAASIGGLAAVASFLQNWSSAAEAPKATTGK